MEVAKITSTSVRIKSKLGSFAVDPADTKNAVETDAVLFLNRTLTQKDLNVASNIVIINGPGEYEIKGVKFTGFGRSDLVAYLGRFDGIETFIVKASTLNTMKDIARDCQIAVIESDVVVDQASIASTNASVIVLYGEKAVDSAALLGKADVASSTKFSVTKDKLPTELQVVVIG